MARRHRWTLSIVSVAALAAAPFIARGDQTPAAAPAAVDAALRTQVIEGAIGHMQKAYIFADIAEKMAAAVRAKAAKNEYDSITAPRELAERLTRDLQEVSRDKHLRIVFNPDGLPSRGGPPTAEERARALAEERRRNFGFEKVERLDGNVGYLDIRTLHDANVAAPIASAAMTLLAGTDVLIIDLRRCPGGSPLMVAHYCSYLFDDPTDLNNIYDRPGDQTRQFWTAPSVPGTKFGGSKPVYVLTGSATFSGAEELAYDLQCRGGAGRRCVRRKRVRHGLWVALEHVLTLGRDGVWRAVAEEAEAARPVWTRSGDDGAAQDDPSRPAEH